MSAVGRVASAVLLAGLISACGLLGPSTTPSPTPPRAGAPSPTAGAGTAPAETSDFVTTSSPAATVSAGATGDPDDLGPFTCALPLAGGGTTPRAQIVDVRVGTHAGYDRVVVEFTGGLPEYDVERSAPPFHDDPSGQPFDVAGSAHLEVTLRGGTKMGDDGSSTYTGPTEFTPRFAQLVELEEAGDFEAQSSWIIGTQAEACVRVLELSGPDRLVIDLQH